MMKQFNDTISVAGATYQNDDLILAKSVKFVIVDNQMLTEKSGAYNFDTITGIITFNTITLDTGMGYYRFLQIVKQ